MFGLLNTSQIYGLQQAHDTTTHHHHSHHPHHNSANNHTNASNNSKSNNALNHSNNHSNNKQQRRSTSSLSDSGKEGSKFFASLSSMQNIKSPTNFIEKFIKSELLSGYDSIKNYKNIQHTSNGAPTAAATSTSSFYISAIPNHSTLATPAAANTTNATAASLQADSIVASFNCLQGSYRSNCDSEFYEAVNINSQSSIKRNTTTTTTATPTSTLTPIATEMIIKCSKNLLAESTQNSQQAPATLQNYQKLPEADCDAVPVVTFAADALALVPSSGASSGEFNSDNNAGDTSSSNTSVSNLYKRLSFGSRGGATVSSKKSEVPLTQTNGAASDNSSSSLTTSSSQSSNTKNNNNNNNSSQTSNKSNDLQRSSSASSSSGDCSSARERKKSLNVKQDANCTTNGKSNLTSASSNTNGTLTPERAQRRKLMQMISNYDQQNKLLQLELAKEKRRRSEELACVVKSLICFESKLKTDMKVVNQRLLEKDVEICRLVRQNRALKKRLANLEKDQLENIDDEGVVEDDGAAESECEAAENEMNKSNKQQLLEDCLVLEALQCINCRMQFYDIDLKESWTQTASSAKDGSRNNDDHTTEHGSSSDDTVSSSFYGARRSVRYTSKRTAGTFRDYMRSRSMNIDDPALDNNSEENTSTISRDDSQTSYEKINIYSRTIERMHGVKCESEQDSEQSGLESTRSVSRLSNKSSRSHSSSGSSSKNSDKSAAKAATQIEEDDGIFSPTQDDDFEEYNEARAELGVIKIVQRRSMEFSEASPKQIYETSTDDWYASASDQEEIGSNTSKPYGHGAVNPVLECVNQILLQQSMEEAPHETAVANSSMSANNEPTQQQQTKTKLQLSQQSAAGNLPRRSSLSDRRSSRSNSHSSEGGQGSRSGTLTRKRVHFSTKNSMVHVPRNDEHDEDDEEDTVPADSEQLSLHTEMISSLQQYQTMTSYFPQGASKQAAAANSASTKILVEVSEQERLETLNYESIYSNEYEPIGSEHNSSNLYVDMEATTKMALNANAAALETKMPKMPPALPPKPANLLKFKKSLQQLDEVADEQDCSAQDFIPLTTHAMAVIPEPDYCSISEVNVNITSVQIVADIHKAPESESELDIEVSTVVSDDTCAASQKTDEIEEIFADIPKLPNVAAIIAPKSSKYQQHQQQQPSQQQSPQAKLQSDYLMLSPKVEMPKLTPNSKSRHLLLNSTTVGTPPKATKLDGTPLKLQLLTPTHMQNKRKHVPNILAEINKRMSQPNSPTTPTKTTPNKTALKSSLSGLTAKELLKNIEENSPSLPLQAEFDWYNLDAEYGKAASNQPDLLKVADNGSNMLAEIHEDHEGTVTTADEYNLDEEFSLASEKPDIIGMQLKTVNEDDTAQLDPNDIALNTAICEAVNFPIFNENSPLVQVAANSPNFTNTLSNAKTKKIKKNLANFEKFIEGSGMSTKPLPNKRKLYFAGPFV